MAEIHGTSGDDSLLGTSGRDVLMGHEGNDTLSGLEGSDNLFGGPGDDTLVGGTSSSGIYVDRDSAYYVDAMAAVHVDLALGVASGGDGNDLLIEIEQVVGSAYDDTLLGDDQNNFLHGMGGKDVLNGAGGSDDLYFYGGDTLTGGDGIDRFYGDAGFEITPGVTLITDLAIDETIDISHLSSVNMMEITAGDGSNVLIGEVQVGAPVGGVTRLFFGTNETPGADYSIDLIGDFSAGDFFTSDLTPIWLTYNPALNQPKWINGNSGWVGGGGGNDTIDGSLAGGQHLYGNAGDDLVIGGSKNDTLSGGMGNDTLLGGDGVDTVQFVYGLNEAVKVDLSLGIVTGGAGNDSLSGIENAYGTDNNDTLIGNDADNYLNGGRESGKLGSDSLYGKGGNDFLDCPTSAAGLMSGGAGNDTMTASSYWLGVMSGDEGNDTFFVRNGNETVIEQAGQGFDTVISSSSTYTLPDGVERGIIATAQAADLSGNAQNNFLRAGAGDNVLDGGAGVDRLAYADAKSGVTVSLAISGSQATGGSGNDTLISIENLAGSRYKDNLSGDAGDNVLLGGFGQDTLTGNGGNDRFDYITLKATGNTPAKADVITDFSTGDLINLKKMDADTATTDNEDFTTLLSAGEDFTQAAQLKFVDGVLYGNVDADLEAEFAIVLTGVTSLSVSDLML